MYFCIVGWNTTAHHIIETGWRFRNLSLRTLTWDFNQRWYVLRLFHPILPWSKVTGASPRLRVWRPRFGKCHFAVVIYFSVTLWSFLFRALTDLYHFLDSSFKETVGWSTWCHMSYTFVTPCSLVTGSAETQVTASGMTSCLVSGLQLVTLVTTNTILENTRKQKVNLQ